MRTRGELRWWAVCVGLFVALTTCGMRSTAAAGHCFSAKSNVRLEPLAPQDSPPGYRDLGDHCFSGILRGPLRGTMIVCLPESDCALDENLCKCDPVSGLWTREGEGGAMAYRARVWIQGSQGGFQAIERGIQVENVGYPGHPYPGPRQYWAGILQVLPGSGTGALAGVSHGTILIHNEWNDPSSARLTGEICEP